MIQGFKAIDQPLSKLDIELLMQRCDMLGLGGAAGVPGQLALCHVVRFSVGRFRSPIIAKARDFKAEVAAAELCCRVRAHMLPPD